MLDYIVILGSFLGILNVLLDRKVHNKLGLCGFRCWLAPLAEHPVVGVGRVVLYLKLALGLEETLSDDKSPVVIRPAKTYNGALPRLSGFLVLARDHPNILNKSKIKLLHDMEYLLVRSLRVKTGDVDGGCIILRVGVRSHFSYFISFCAVFVCVYVLNNPGKVFQFFFGFLELWAFFNLYFLLI
jgi:hypothetical protein